MNRKIKKLYYLRSELMCLIEQLKLLTEKISVEENIINSQILGSISYSIIKRADRLNRKVATLFKL